MKLTSTSDYILEYVPSDEPCVNTNERTINHFINHANLVKRILVLGMFVPCNKFNELMLEPDLEELTDKCAYEGLMLDYKEAKDRRLFKGFEVSTRQHLLPFRIDIGIESENTIEWLVKEGVHLILNSNAIKLLSL